MATLVLAEPGLAEEAPSPAVSRSMALMKARSVKCVFTNGVFTVFEKTAFESKPAGQKPIDLHFDAIDTKEGTARVIGNQGAGDVSVFATLGGLTFMEPVGSGGLNFTTVFGDSTGLENEYLGVHSRHRPVPMELGGPMLSQWYGTCRILQ